MSDRLFTPPGPQVTPAESRGRRAHHLAAQEALPLADPIPPADQPCPACSSPDAGHDCGHAAQTLEIR